MGGLYVLQRMELTNINAYAQERASYALLKFCVDHQRDDEWVNHVKACHEALSCGDMKKAYESYTKVPLGGNGCFNDWFPPVVFDHEDKEYVWTVFESLCANWSRMMMLAREPE